MERISSPAVVTSATDARRQMMLRGPTAGALVRLAAPTVVVVTIQALVGMTETCFVGLLGTEALAGVALVFPGKPCVARSA